MGSQEEVYEFSESDLDSFLRVAVRLAGEAGAMISTAMDSASGGGGRMSVATKTGTGVSGEGTGSSVLTETDTAVEKHLVQGFAKEFPDHCFIGEEDISSSESGMVETFTNKPTWIIDPIDGTMNFVHNNPLVCTSIGLAINKKLVLGVVNNPVTGHLYSAVRGKGAYLNGTKLLKTSGVTKLSDAMVLMELSVRANDDKRAKNIENITMLMTKAHSIRCPGPAALDISWVGAGSADCFFHSGIHCWDMAAGAVIVREAGGAVLSADGSDFDLMSRGIVAAASPELAKELANSIKVYTKCGRDMASPCLAF